MPEDQESLAAAIRKISKAAGSLERSGLHRDAVVVLLAHDSKLSLKMVRKVLDSLGDLARNYTR
jgi:hypothetical protein